MCTVPVLLGLLLAQTSPNLNAPQAPVYNRGDVSKGMTHAVVFEGSTGTTTLDFNGTDYVEPGETVTVACLSLSASPTVGAALNWYEEF